MNARQGAPLKFANANNRTQQHTCLPRLYHPCVVLAVLWGRWTTGVHCRICGALDKCESMGGRENAFSEQWRCNAGMWGTGWVARLAPCSHLCRSVRYTSTPSLASAAPPGCPPSTRAAQGHTPDPSRSNGGQRNRHGSGVTCHWPCPQIQKHNEPRYRRALAEGCGVGWVETIHASERLHFFLIRRSHSISFTRAQGIPKYKTGLGRGKG